MDSRSGCRKSLFKSHHTQDFSFYLISLANFYIFFQAAMLYFKVPGRTPLADVEVTAVYMLVLQSIYDKVI